MSDELLVLAVAPCSRKSQHSPRKRLKLSRAQLDCEQPPLRVADPKIPLDTKSVERALRGVALGRKNHYGSRPERGTRTAALFYSLIESAKLCHVEPRAYLKEATLRAVRNPGTATLARDLKSPRS